MKNNLSSIFEVIWFVLGGLICFIAVDVTVSKGIGESWYYFVFSILAFIMYLFRRRMRLSKR